MSRRLRHAFATMLTLTPCYAADFRARCYAFIIYAIFHGCCYLRRHATLMRVRAERHTCALTTIATLLYAMPPSYHAIDAARCRHYAIIDY